MGAAILGFLQALPQLVKLLDQLIKVTSDFVEVKRLEIAQRQIEEASRKAEHEKDTSDLDRLFNGKPKPKLSPDSET